MVLWKNKPDDSAKIPDKETAIRSMGGNSGSLDAAVSAAPDSTADGIAAPTSTRAATTRRRSRSQQPDVQQPQANAQTLEDIARAEKRKAALQKMSEMMLADMAGAPYEFWAAVIDDDDMKLTEEEAQELGEAYQIVAESLPMGNMPSWITLPLFILGRNARLVRKRIKLSEANAEKKAMEKLQRNKLPV